MKYLAALILFLGGCAELTPDIREVARQKKMERRERDEECLTLCQKYFHPDSLARSISMNSCDCWVPAKYGDFRGQSKSAAIYLEYF